MKSSLLALLLLLLFPTAMGSLFARERAADTTESGIVRELRESKRTNCGCAMVYLTLATDSGRIAIKLAPRSYFDQNGMTLAVGNRVDVSGFKDKEDGKDIMVAWQIRRGAEWLLMRSRTGQIMWESNGDHTCPYGR